ncbi:MAG TPA: carboxypeptidase regulatory-like domain-containing protein [Gemmatimonadaceae bacterium]|nr:carboxypeptidase regulatory-like domain-containing protein [Gemmatimonadaceae bacterium]
MARQLQLFMAVFLIAFARPLGAQNNTAPTPPASSKTGKAQIVGVVVDSLNGGYLSGAEVVVQGARATLQTDSLGKFKIDSLPPGTYQVGVYHALLDTLGITLATQPFHIGPDSSSFVLLAVPSAATIIRRLCPVRPGAQGKSAVIGYVNDPETLEPVAQAEVSIAWTDIEVSKAFGIRRTSRLVRDSTDGSGAFKICGLPSSLQATLQARRGSTVTADIPISLGDKPAELFARTLLLSPADSGAKVGNATVSGLVVLEGSPTNSGSRVELVGTDIVAMTNEKGEFTMRNLPSGSKVLLARHLGFGAETVPVDLSSRQQKRVTIRLPKFVALMDPVLVTARKSAALDRVGFNQRKKSGFGYYIGPDRLQNMHPNFLTDILRQVPGLRTSYGPEGEVISSSRGFGSGCVQYWIDDMPWQSFSPGDINHFVTGSEIVAVEVYQDLNTPGRYMRAGGSCTTIVLWTRFKIRS